MKKPAETIGSVIGLGEPQASLFPPVKVEQQAPRAHSHSPGLRQILLTHETISPQYLLLTIVPIDTDLWAVFPEEWH